MPYLGRPAFVHCYEIGFQRTLVLLFLFAAAGRLRRRRLVSSFTSSCLQRLILLVFPVRAFVSNRVRTVCVWSTRTNPLRRPLTVTSNVSLTTTSRATILGRSLAVTCVVTPRTACAQRSGCILDCERHALAGWSGESGLRGDFSIKGTAQSLWRLGGCTSSPRSGPRK
jgi:hypothetical protein